MEFLAIRSRVRNVVEVHKRFCECVGRRKTVAKEDARVINVETVIGIQKLLPADWPREYEVNVCC